MEFHGGHFTAGYKEFSYSQFRNILRICSFSLFSNNCKSTIDPHTFASFDDPTKVNFSEIRYDMRHDVNHFSYCYSRELLCDI